MKRLVPGVLYSEQFPEGKRFKVEDEYLKALGEGFVEHPRDIGKAKPKEEEVILPEYEWPKEKEIPIEPEPAKRGPGRPPKDK